jgi:hypothetical protein
MQVGQINFNLFFKKKGISIINRVLQDSTRNKRLAIDKTRIVKRIVRIVRIVDE